MSDLIIDRLEMSVEGANGKLPNLDLFNTIIQICKTVQFRCNLRGEKGAMDYTHYSFDRDPIDHQIGLENTIAMVFSQATGVSTGAHGNFLEQRIEALSIKGVLVQEKNLNRKHFKQSVLKVTRYLTKY